MLEGYPVLSEEASRFVKNFMDVDIRPEGIMLADDFELGFLYRKSRIYK